MHTGKFGDYLFPKAASIWLEAKRNAVSTGMAKDYRDWIRTLEKFFGAMKLSDIHVGNVHAYQKERGETCGASIINHEIMTLGQIMAVAGLWEPIKKFYRALSLPESIGMVLEPSEEDALFKMCQKKPRWLVCYCGSKLTNATTAGPGELRHLQIRDINLVDRVMIVRRALKNKYRERTIPLNDDAVWALEKLIDRYRQMCKRYDIHPEPTHYLFFHRADKRGDPPDPTRCTGVWRRAWESMRKELAKQFPHLANLRRYDLRHNATTKMAEAGVPEPVMRELLGHKPNSKVIERYTHIRMQPRREAVEYLQRRPKAIAAHNGTVVMFRQLG